MVRKYNYTGRIKIPNDRITIFQGSNNGIKYFDAKFELSDLEFPDSAKIYIEPYFKSSFMRFDFGTIARIIIPGDTSLRDIPITDRILYRVKVVDETTKAGLILGYSDELIASTGDEQGGKISLLPVDYIELGSRIWKVEFRDEGPVLAVNREENIDNIGEIVSKDGKFKSLIYPEVVRQIALRIAINEDFDWNENDSTWECRWVKFFRDNLGISHAPESNEEKHADIWSDDVSEAFCRKHKVIHLLKIDM